MAQAATPRNAYFLALRTSLDGLHCHGDALPAADAQGNDAAADAVTLHRMQQTRHQDGTC